MRFSKSAIINKLLSLSPGLPWSVAILPAPPVFMLTVVVSIGGLMTTSFSSLCKQQKMTFRLTRKKNQPYLRLRFDTRLKDPSEEAVDSALAEEKLTRFEV